MDGHYEGRIIFLLGRFVFVVVVGAFLSICTPQAQKVGTIDLKRSHIRAHDDPADLGISIRMEIRTLVEQIQAYF